MFDLFVNKYTKSVVSHSWLKYVINDDHLKRKYLPELQIFRKAFQNEVPEPQNVTARIASSVEVIETQCLCKGKSLEDVIFGNVYWERELFVKVVLRSQFQVSLRLLALVWNVLRYSSLLIDPNFILEKGHFAAAVLIF